MKTPNLPTPVRPRPSLDRLAMRRSRWLVKPYWSTAIFWIFRLNIVVFSDLRTVEVTVGMFGGGILIQLNYGRRRDICAA